VSIQVNIPITLGSSQETILCDIIPMDVGHILLSYPWLSDHKAIHDVKSNKISFHHVGKRITLCPLTSTQVKADQIALQNLFENEKRKKTKTR